jgi:hypothetical protein
MGWPTVIKLWLQAIEDEAGMGRPAGPPIDDPPGVDIDDEGNVNIYREALGGHVRNLEPERRTSLRQLR